MTTSFIVDERSQRILKIRRDTWQAHTRSTFLRVKVNPGLMTFMLTLQSLRSQPAKSACFLEPHTNIRVLCHFEPQPTKVQDNERLRRREEVENPKENPKDKKRNLVRDVRATPFYSEIQHRVDYFHGNTSIPAVTCAHSQLMPKRRRLKKSERAEMAFA